MSHYKYSYMTLLLCLPLLAVVVTPVISENSAMAGNGAGQDHQNIVDKLQAVTVDKPAYITNFTVVTIMRAAGETKRVDVLALLIKGLAYHRDPRVMNEPIEPQDFLPAIRVLKENYGSQALPYLYVEGINTDKVWLRRRCAYAIRHIANNDELTRYNSTFSLKQTTSVNGKELLTLLTADTLNIRSDQEIFGTVIPSDQVRIDTLAR